MAFGLTLTGFNPKTFTDIRDEIEASFRQNFGANVDLTPQSVLGQVVGVMADQFAELWEVAQAVDSGFDPNAAEGEALDALAAITGTFRNPPLPSEVTLQLTGTPGTVVVAGREASTSDTGERFGTDDNVTITAAAAWAGTTAYDVGDRVTNSGNIYQCTVAGTSAASGGPSGFDTAIVDGTVTWTFVGIGTGIGEVLAKSLNTGPIVGTARSITVIETPVSGWVGVTNLGSAQLGSDLENDTQLRLRRAQELGASATATIEAIIAAVGAVPGVTLRRVFENADTIVDPSGLPPHSFEVVVEGGEDEDLADAIFEMKPAGITAFGTTIVTVTDSQGIDHDIGFSRPTDVDVWVDVTVETGDGYPSDGDDQVAAAINSFGATYVMGQDVYASALKAQLFAIPGVLNVVSANIGLSASPPDETPVSVDVREIARFSLSRITVTSSPGVF